MDIMKSTGVDFSGLAEKISSDFLERGTPLADGIVAQAKRLSLKPEEVRRLVEKTNTACSIKVMRSSDDKKKQFELADKNAVLAETHGFDRADANGAADQSKPDSDKTGSGKPCASEKTASAFPVTRGIRAAAPGEASAYPASVTSEKNAPEKTDSEKTAQCLSEPKTAGDVFRLKAGLDAIKQEKIAVELSLQKHLDSLCNTYRGRAADFCKEASAYLSAYPKSTAAPYLKAVNAHLGGGALTKTAGLVDDTTPFMRTCVALDRGHERLAKLASDISEKERSVRGIYESVPAIFR